ncbi:MAG TPA: hypothetical protein GX400_00405 [Chloroflexi bacterium]|nr:hypothetical protein [Chloroflexota bacterium]
MGGSSVATHTDCTCAAMHLPVATAAYTRAAVWQIEAVCRAGEAGRLAACTAYIVV